MLRNAFLILTVSLVGLSSCRKDRTCTCTDANGTNLGTATYTNAKRSEVKPLCDANQSQFQTSNPGATCTLR